MLRLHNFYEHPVQQRYMVYEFSEEEAAIYFEQMLINANIEYEKSEEQRNTSTFYLFGISKRFLNEANLINNTTLLKYKKPFIPVAGLRWLLLCVTIGALALAILGYLKTQG